MTRFLANDTLNSHFSKRPFSSYCQPELSIGYVGGLDCLLTAVVHLLNGYTLQTPKPISFAKNKLFSFT